MVQNCLIRFVLAPLAKLAHLLSQKTLDRLFVLSGLALFGCFFLYSADVIKLRYLYYFAACCLCFGLMILTSLPEEIRPVKWNWLMFGPWILMALLLTASALYNTLDYLTEAVLFLVAYPVVFISWNNLDREKIIRKLIRVVQFSGVMFFAVSFLLIEITTKKYGGIFKNVNNCAFYLVVVAACSAANLIGRPKLSWRSMGDILLFGACQGMMYYTNSRTGQLALYVMALVALVVYLLAHRKDGKQINLRFLLRFGCCVVASVVLMNSMVFLFQLRQYIPLPYYEKTVKSFYFSPEWEKRLFAQPDQPGVTPGVPQEGFLVEFFDTQSFAEVKEEKTKTEGKNLNSYSTGRLTIWKEFTGALNWTGHDREFLVCVINTNKEPIIINTAHMTVLEFAYESGIVAGALYLAINLISGVLAICYAIKRKAERYAMFPLLLIVVFGVCSMLATMNNSFSYMATFYYYLALFPLMVREPQPALKEGEGKES